MWFYRWLESLNPHQCRNGLAHVWHSSNRFLCSWNAGLTQAPQLHCMPAQLKEPNRALQPMHCSFSSTWPSCTACIHFMGSTNMEEHSDCSFSVRSPLLFLHLKHFSPWPRSCGTMFSCAATIRRHFLQRYMTWGFGLVSKSELVVVANCIQGPDVPSISVTSVWLLRKLRNTILKRGNCTINSVTVSWMCDFALNFFFSCLFSETEQRVRVYKRQI